MDIIKKILVSLVILEFALNSNAQEYIWIETELFDDLGGWTNDYQFIDQMGSPYLMAIGYGKPVPNAKTKINIQNKGKYKLWARTKDWVPEFHPGKFEIYINNVKASKTFGESGENGWIWEEGGIFQLDDKEITVELHDLTGYYGRCDVIVLCSDLNWVPPNDKDELKEIREKYSSVSGNITNMGTYDVVVIGGGIAGTLAAVAAARQGARTVLIQNRGELGGNASSEHLIPPVGVLQNLLPPSDRKYDPRETGIIEEVSSYGNQRYFIDGKFYPSRLKRLVDGQKNLDLFLKMHAIDVEMNNEREISSVICHDIMTSQKKRFKGKIFIDATGNGTIGLWAGAEFMVGRESKKMFNETKAPDESNNTTLPSSLKYWYIPSEKPQKFITPNWIYSYTNCSEFQPYQNRHPKLGSIDSQWVIELGGTDQVYENAEFVRDDLLRLIYGLWDHIKNHCTDPVNVNADKMKLVWVGHVLSMRESYRLKGDYIMSEKDILEQTLFEDRVAYGGWGLDDHPSLGFFCTEQLNDATHSGVIFSIPYRSLYSKNINNLMMAGRNISVTHVALTATRVMLTTGVIGQAVGTAAGMCINKNTSPRGIYQKYIVELQQQLMKDGAFLIEMPNRDPNDIALKARATASSEITDASEVINGFSRARLPSYFLSNIVSDRYLRSFREAQLPIHLLNTEKNLNAWLPDFKIDGPHWLQLSWNQIEKFNVVHIIFQNRDSLAWKNFRIEIHDGEKWETLINVNNSKAFRRLVLPVGNVKAKDLRIISEDQSIIGGICEVRVYDEPFSVVETIQQANIIMNMPDDEILLPWE